MSRIISRRRCGSPTASWCCRGGPGRIREVVTIPMTRSARGDIHAREQLLTLQSELWSLIREQAVEAEREVQHA